jgi:hypothetical protein
MRHATEAEAGGLLRVLLVWIRPLPADPSELILLQGASYGMSPAPSTASGGLNPGHVEKLRRIFGTPRHCDSAAGP